ncbi:HD-GYP domain-containing protein [Acetobacterium tundrae]|uniref:HD-GYP domain-containing protein n=1 Tax=Acetobacterium tundrae TaxID=132932 RepID=A0ABR6WN74_9FIRM|nr:HD domain-containing phosphohydrolase [Acetobacterium tundrae]MBC3797955.1 hypothetical protein [Acetobacterium tundrae]
MLLELKKNLSNLIFQKDYTYSRVTEYLAHMYESIDSSGYPLNAASDYVGVLPKIIAVADVYDAMTTDRVYKKGAKLIEAIEFLSNEGRKTLDNQVLMLFLRNIPLYDFKSVSMTKQGGQFNCKSIPF